MYATFIGPVHCYDELQIERTHLSLQHNHQSSHAIKGSWAYPPRNIRYPTTLTTLIMPRVEGKLDLLGGHRAMFRPTFEGLSLNRSIDCSRREQSIFQCQDKGYACLDLLKRALPLLHSTFRSPPILRPIYGAAKEPPILRTINRMDVISSLDFCCLHEDNLVYLLSNKWPGCRHNN